VDGLPENIRYSETFAVPAAQLMRAVRENGFEGIVAKRARSTYRSGRSDDWIKWRANCAKEIVIGGYVPASNTFDSLLVGCYEGRDLMYAARIRAGLVAESRRALLSHFAELRIEQSHSAISPSGPRAAGVRVLPQKTWKSAAGSHRA
jgi:bifunctional non-homologous end joining protein LigD